MAGNSSANRMNAKSVDISDIISWMALHIGYRSFLSNLQRESGNAADADYASCSLSNEELLILENGHASIHSLVKSIAKSRQESARIHNPLFQDERIVVNNIKRMYEMCIQRKQQQVHALRQEIKVLSANKLLLAKKR